MKKLVVVMVSIVVLASCKSSKTSCEAYGSKLKITSTTKHIKRR